MTKGLIYFAHCYLEYPIDDTMMHTIKRYFEDEYEVINPKIFGFPQMTNYIKIVTVCDALIFHPQEEDIISAGTAKEIDIAYQMNKPIFWIDDKQNICAFITNDIDNIFKYWNVLNVSDTRKRMKRLVANGTYPKPSWWT